MKKLGSRKLYSCSYIFLCVKALLQMNIGFSPSLEMPSSVLCVVIWDRAISFTSVDTALLCIAELRPNEQEKIGISP